MAAVLGSVAGGLVVASVLLPGASTTALAALAEAPPTADLLAASPGQLAATGHARHGAYGVSHLRPDGFGLVAANSHAATKTPYILAGRRS